MTETTILDEGAVSEIEARRDTACRPEENWQQWHDLILWILNTDIPALCATVKHLRWQVDLCEKAFELDGALKLSEVGDLNALQVVRKMVDLQSQLEQLRTATAQMIETKCEEYRVAHDARLAILNALEKL